MTHDERTPAPGCTVRLNGEPHELPDGTTVAVLVATTLASPRGTAVVVDDEVVPRSRWSQVTLRDGQRVELITAVQGG
ncbi:MAG: sulfur carrier protein ThiS [Jatrophihabitans sp.]|nr:MAG: sulfur carrier protein ThiS [Jatrophihabitans sp.]